MPFRWAYCSKYPTFEKLEVLKSTNVPFYGTFLPFFGYNARMPLFSRISPEDIPSFMM